MSYKFVIGIDEVGRGSLAGPVVVAAFAAPLKSKIKNPWPGRQRSKLRVPSVKVISAWRYPGVTKAGEALPREILAELRSAIR